MRWVNRGAEPSELEAIRAEHTQFWVDNRGNTASHPDTGYKSSLWIPFRDNELIERFYNKCGYCERKCDDARERTRNDDDDNDNPKSPELDHFKPKSKFPTLTYVWGNWIFSCKECNDIKSDQCPDGGFVDPCADDVMERPEEYFDFDYDEYIMELMPKSGLDDERKRRAQQTINDLDLNDLQQYRNISERSGSGLSEMFVARAYQVTFFRDRVLETAESERQGLIDRFTAPNQEFAGIISMVANQMRRAGEI